MTFPLARLATLIDTGCEGIDVAVHACDDEGKTALHIAAGTGMLDAVALLLENGAKADAQVSRRRSFCASIRVRVSLAL